tara:strand:+ start:1894 stop:3729 length:1836 start_codon:yes stop_codon:yes gene_type:complete
MANYKDIKGFRVQSYATDPVPSVAGWTSGGNLPAGRYVGGGFGTQTANSYAGGIPPATSGTNTTDNYNGSTWTSGGNLGTARYGMGAGGTQTAGLVYGGYNSGFKSNTEEYDGSSWTNGGTLTNTRSAAAGAGGGIGTQTAGLAVGGYIPTAPPGYQTDYVEEYNGSSWTAVTVTPATGSYRGGLGIQTAGLVCGVSRPGPAGGTSNITLEYDGTNWTAGGNLTYNVNRVMTAGSQTAGMAYGGLLPPNTVFSTTALYDGSSWTNASATLGAARYGGSGGGTQTSAIMASGTTVPGIPNVSTATEEYNDYSEPNSFENIGQTFYNTTEKKYKYTNQTFSASWASSGNLGTARAGGGNSKNGTYNAVVHFGGYTPPGATAVNNVEHYNGTSWTGATAMPTAIRNNAGCGTQTAALAVGGVGNPGNSLEYNGSSWTAGGSMTNLTSVPGQATGLQTAALAFDAEESEEYNGTSWTAGGTPARGKVQGNCAGTQTAAIAFGGEPGAVATAEFYNGTSWTTAPSMNAGKQNLAGFGTQTSAISAGGTPAPSAVCEVFNGSSWSTTASLNTARSQVEGSGLSANGMIAGGWISAPTNVTENFEGADAVTIKTVTTS